MKINEYLAPWNPSSTARVVVMDVDTGAQHELWNSELRVNSYMKPYRGTLVDIGEMVITMTWFEGNTLLIYARFRKENYK